MLPFKRRKSNKGLHHRSLNPTSSPLTTRSHGLHTHAPLGRYNKQSQQIDSVDSPLNTMESTVCAAQADSVVETTQDIAQEEQVMQPSQQTDPNERTIVVDPTPGVMRIKQFRNAARAMTQQMDEPKNNPFVRLVFQCGEMTQEYEPQFAVVNNFCPAIEAAIKEAQIQVTNETKLILIVLVNSLERVQAVVAYLAKFKTLVDGRGMVAGMDKEEGDAVLHKYNETFKIAVALGMTSFADQTKAYIKQILYSKDKVAWFIPREDIRLIFEHNARGYWLRADIASSIAKAKRDGKLRGQDENIPYLQQHHPGVNTIITNHISQMDAAEAAHKTAQI